VLGELATTSLQVLLALHPTPAVSGHPAPPAGRFIRATEGVDRRHFAGLVGWCDSRGDGKWVLMLHRAKRG